MPDLYPKAVFKSWKKAAAMARFATDYAKTQNLCNLTLVYTVHEYLFCADRFVIEILGIFADGEKLPMGCLHEQGRKSLAARMKAAS